MEPSPVVARRRRARWIWLGAVLALVGLLTALFGFGLRGDPTIVRSPLVGRGAPGFDLRALNGGGRVRLSSLRGQVVVVNFWASWCGPCRVEHPALEAAWARYRDQGVVVLGIGYQDRPGDARAFLRELGGDWPVLLDPGSRTALAYGVTGVPETFFVDRRGRVAYKAFGPVSYEVLTDQINALLPGGSEGS
jgi:cytochrome c biogenesis protein CcmG, thiol:disulfide interchange protein DsbE